MTNGQDHEPSRETGDVGRRGKASLADLAGGLLTGLASQAVVLTAVLFYFGWARERATMAYFGVDDLGVLNFSVTDYVLRSVGTALPLLMAIGFVAVSALVVHGMASESLAGNKPLRDRVARTLITAGACLVIAGFALALTLTGTGGSGPEGPAVMVVGLVLTSYALVLRDRGREGNRQAGSRLILVVWSLVLIALLWSVTGYADYIGTEAAQQLQAGLPGAANITVYSATNLYLSGPGITMSPATVPDSQYHFRYTGLRLLVSSGGQLFLLPSGWRPGNGAVIMLPATSGGTRIEFQQPG